MNPPSRRRPNAPAGPSPSAGDAPSFDMSSVVPGTPQRVSLSDVATRAGVSTATVSRVLNGTAIVGKGKEDAVRRACDELGYVVNGAARALSSKRSRTIGAVVPTLSNQTFARLLSAFQSRVHEAGFTLLLASSEFDPTVELNEVVNLLEHGIDALMIVGHSHDPKMWHRIERSGVPCIQALSLDKTRPSVGYDNVAIGRRMTDHLLAFGHARLGIIVGTPPTNDRVADRIVGIRRRLSKDKLTLAAHHVIKDAFTVEEARSATLHLLSLPDAPTAIICGNDSLAFGVLVAAKERGLTVPDDLSIIGFNNYDFAAYLSPPLTTIDVDLVALGEQAAAYLLSELRAGPRAPVPRIRAELLVRGSTGRAPRGR